MGHNLENKRKLYFQMFARIHSSRTRSRFCFKRPDNASILCAGKTTASVYIDL